MLKGIHSEINNRIKYLVQRSDWRWYCYHFHRNRRFSALWGVPDEDAVAFKNLDTQICKFYNKLHDFISSRLSLTVAWEFACSENTKLIDGCTRPDNLPLILNADKLQWINILFHFSRGLVKITVIKFLALFQFEIQQVTPLLKVMNKHIAHRVSGCGGIKCQRDRSGYSDYGDSSQNLGQKAATQP